MLNVTVDKQKLAAYIICCSMSTTGCAHNEMALSNSL